MLGFAVKSAGLVKGAVGAKIMEAAAAKENLVGGAAGIGN